MLTLRLSGKERMPLSVLSRMWRRCETYLRRENKFYSQKFYFIICMNHLLLPSMFSFTIVANFLKFPFQIVIFNRYFRRTISCSTCCGKVLLWDRPWGLSGHQPVPTVRMIVICREIALLREMSWKWREGDV